MTSRLSIKNSLSLAQNDGFVKCWGDNYDGQLGLGDWDARGDVPNGECFDALVICIKPTSSLPRPQTSMVRYKESYG